MHKGLWWVCGMWLVATPVFAQLPEPTIPIPASENQAPADGKLLPPVIHEASATQPAEVPKGDPLPVFNGQKSMINTSKPGAIDLGCCRPACSRRIWGNFEYLYWWVKSAPIPQPMVTTGDPNVGFAQGINSAGGIGQPGTAVLFGNQSVNFGGFSGGRILIGAWLDDEQSVGIEAGGFLFERRSSTFAAGSDAAGNPPLYFPGFNVVNQFEAGNQIADPLRLFAGDVFITNVLQLWGTEINGVFTLTRRPCFQAYGLVGFRYMDLKENLYLHNTTTDLLFLNTETSDDTFDTRNQFYGGQLGLRGVWQQGPWSTSLTAKIALGSTHQVVNIAGSSSETALPGGFAPVPGQLPGGIYAQSTNSGRVTNNEFTVIPAIEFKVGYQVTQSVKVFAGYDFLYWNQVVRPGNQIDHNINPSQTLLFGTGAFTGQPAPLNPFQRTDFWAHGLTFGFEVRF